MIIIFDRKGELSNNQLECGICAFQDVTVLQMQSLAAVFKHFKEKVGAPFQR
jgi:hypothetical protein